MLPEPNVHLEELSDKHWRVQKLPRDQETLSMLSDPSKRPPTLRDPDAMTLAHRVVSTRTKLGRIYDLPREEPQQAHQA